MLGSRAVLVASLLAAGCGGKVVVDGFGDSGGAGGSGSSSSSASSASSASSVASSSSGQACIDAGDCGECFSCTTDTTCSAAAQACDSNPQCEQFMDCTSSCQDIGPDQCFDKCQGAFPQGASEYVAWVQCAACEACPASCSVPFSFFCG